MVQTYSLSDLKHIKPTILHSWFIEGKSPHGKFMVIDVRDEDYIGGHIKGSRHCPSNNFLRSLPKLRKVLYDQKIDDVVFHCMLSQARGPSSALKFLRSLKTVDDPDEAKYFKDVHVYVLKGGFQRWAREYGKDSRVTEGFNEELWDYY